MAKQGRGMGEKYRQPPIKRKERKWIMKVALSYSGIP